MNDHRTLYAFLISSFIFTILVYALLFEVNSNNLKNCNERNFQFAEVNKRANTINDLIKLEKAETDEHSPEALEVIADDFAKQVPLTNCEESFPSPFPFNLI